MMDDEITISQACMYCLEPLGTRMIPIHVSSRAYGNSQFWLHPACMRAAFEHAAAPLTQADLDDMTVEIRGPSTQ